MQRSQSKFLRQLSCCHGVWQILLVCKHQNHSIAQFVLVQHVVQLLLCLDDALSVVGIDDKNEPLRVLEVMTPQRADLVLASDVPNGEADIFVLDCLDVEADGWNGCDDLAQLQFVEDCSFTSSIETD